MLVREAYIFIPIRGVETVAARVQHHKERNGVDRFYFRYGDSFRFNPNAFSIDPRQLPLTDKTMIFPKLPLALQDNGPDDFGKYLYERLHHAQPESPLDYHVGNGVHGIGALAFSDTLKAPSEGKLSVSIASIEALIEAYKALEKKQPIPPRLETLLVPGTSLGGARPKALLEDENHQQWIVKFNRENDIFDMAIAEYAAMTAAKKAGINVAESRVIRVGDNRVYLTKRFDRCHGTRQHFLSAFTFMGADRARLDRVYSTFSYPSLAQMIKRISSCPTEDRAELFRRMVFNILCGNCDDHLKNHGFIKDEEGPLYRLSPAYDIVPAAGTDIHAIGIGDEGPKGSIDNALSRYVEFGLDKVSAKHIVDKVRDAVNQLPQIARENGMGDMDVSLLKRRILSE